jgi:hypothetical protein
LRLPEGVGRNPDLTHGVVFDPIVGHGITLAP